MQPTKKVKPNPDSIKPLITEEVKIKPKNKKKAPAPEVDIEEVPEAENEETKVSRIERNREIERDVYGFEVRKAQRWVNKQRVLLLSSRGQSVHGRFVMMDIFNMLPHAKKENKIEKIDMQEQINELCTLASCNNVLFFESRKKRDLYLWVGKFPTGPSTKFHVENVHTTEELRMTGNCLKGSRPLLSFDAEFDASPHYKLMKELLVQTFGTPHMHPKSKPFYDHVFAFSVVDNRIWFRNYQIVYNQEEKDLNDLELIEIGPRFVLNPIKTFDGCMNGSVLFSNEFYVSPNKTRRDLKYKKALERAKKVGVKRAKKEEMMNLSLPEDEVDRIFGREGEEGEDLEGGEYQDGEEDLDESFDEE